jgi:hypothetical protein
LEAFWSGSVSPPPLATALVIIFRRQKKANGTAPEYSTSSRAVP